MLGDKKRGLISNPRKKSPTNINLGRGAVSPLMFKHVRTFKTCTETWEGRNLSPDSQAMPDRHLENFELSIPSDCQDCNRTQTLRKQSKLQPSTLDCTRALVPVFGFSLAFPSFLLLTLGGPRDTPHWTKLSPARNSHDWPHSTRSYDMPLAGNSTITTNPILPELRFQHADRSRDKFAAAFPPLLKLPQSYKPIECINHAWY